MLKKKVQDQWIQHQSASAETGYEELHSSEEEQTYFIKYSAPFEIINNLRISYEKNYELIARMLSLCKKPHMVQFKSIQKLKTQQGFQLRMRVEKGQPYNQETNYFSKEMHRNDAPISEIFQFICDACAGLIELGELKMVHLDLKLPNIIKTKKAFKIIDFDHAMFLSLTNNLIEHKNYLNESQLQQIQEKLIKNTRSIIRREITAYKLNKDFSKSHFLSALHSIGCLNDIMDFTSLDSTQDDKVMENLDCLRKNIDLIHIKQFQCLITQYISKQEIMNIDKYRKVKGLSKQNKAEGQFKTFEVLLTQLFTRKITLKSFYQQLDQQNKLASLFQVNRQLRKNSQLMDNIYRRKEYLAENQMLKSEIQDSSIHPEEAENKWLSYEFQKAIILKCRQQLDRLKQGQKDIIKENYVQKQVNLSSLLSDLKIKDFPTHIQESQQQSRMEMCQSQVQVYSHFDAQESTLRRCQKNAISRNMKDNYFVFKLLTLSKLTTINQPQYNLIPQFITFNAPQKKFHLYFQKIQQEWPQNTCYKKKFESIWSKGFPNVIKFIKQTCEGILNLEKNGLFHPQLNMDSIVSCIDSNGHQKYKIGSIERSFYLDFTYNMNNEETIINSTKMIMNYLINNEKQLRQYLPEVAKHLNSLNPVLDVFSNNYPKNYQGVTGEYQNMLKASRTQWLTQFLKEYFKKIHSLFGNSLIELLDHNDIMERSNWGKIMHPMALIPPYWLDKCKKMKQFMRHLTIGDIKKRMNIEEFMIEINALFPTCKIKGHCKEMVFYYYREEKQYLCNRCIEHYGGINIPLLCIDHDKPLMYVQRNKKTHKYFGRMYYCEECIKYLAIESTPQIIDPKDLNACQSICLDIKCQQNFISAKNLKKNHHDHHTYTVQQFQTIYSQFSIENSESLVDQCRKKSSGLLSNIGKTFNHHISDISTLFHQMKMFKGQQDETIYKFNNILYPNRNKIDKPKNDQTSNNPLLWKMAKVLNHLRLERQKSQYDDALYLCAEGFVEYANDKYRQLAGQSYSVVKKILQETYEKLESDIFSHDIHEKIVSHLGKKYQKIVINEVKNEIVPCNLNQISQKFDSLVKQLTISKSSIGQEEYYGQKIQQMLLFQRLNQQKMQSYKKWVQLINQENENYKGILNSRRFKSISPISKYSQVVARLKILINSQNSYISKQIDQKTGDKSQLTELKRLNAQQEALNQQKEQIQKRFNQLKNNYDRSPKKNSDLLPINIESDKSIVPIISEIQQLKIQINRQLNIFFRKKYFQKRILCENQLEKIYKMHNLNELSINLEKNYTNYHLPSQIDNQFALTGKNLQKIIENCPNMNKIVIKGGHIELMPCLLQISRSNKNHPNFVFHVDTNDVIKTKEEYQQLNPLLGQYKFPCFNLALRKDIEEEETEIIMRLLDGAQQIKLQVEGPLMKNGRIKAILNKVAEKEGLFVTALTLKKFQIGKNNQLLIKMAKKCGDRITKIKLSRCFDYNSDFLHYCHSLKQFEMISSVHKVIEPCFIISLFQCSNLESLKLLCCNFDADIVSLKNLNNLKNIELKFCPKINDKFLNTIHHKSLGTIIRLFISNCPKITNHIMESLEKMGSLRSLILSEVNIRPINLLKIQSQQMKVLEIPFAKDGLSPHLLEKVGKKWPKIMHLGIGKCFEIKSSFFKQSRHFNSLKNIHIHVDQFTEEEKYALRMRKIHIEEYD